MCCSCIGLIEVGTTLANPFGSEPEDFAVFTFIEAATCNAKLSITGDLPEAVYHSGALSKPGRVRVDCDAAEAQAPAMAQATSAPVS